MVEHVDAILDCAKTIVIENKGPEISDMSQRLRPMVSLRNKSEE
jgi:hypothetical protein